MKKILLKFFQNSQFIYFFLLFTLFSVGQVLTQPSITWQRFYDGGFNVNDYCNGICKLLDGNIVLVGVTSSQGVMIIKINNYGDTLWMRHYGGVGIGLPETPGSNDGGYLVATNDGGFLIPIGWKFNSSGESIWQRHYDSTGVFNIYDGMQTSDLGFLSCGRNVQDSGFVIKTDSLGYLLWYKIISDSINQTVRMYSVNETYSNDYLSSGYTSGLNQPVSLVVVRFAPNGQLMWKKVFRNNSIDGLTSRIYKIPPYYWIFSRNGYIIIDDNGNIIKEKIIHISQEDIYSVQMLSSNKFAAVFNIFPGPPNLYSSLKIIDTSGNILISRLLKFSEYVKITKVIQTFNRDLIFSGSAEPDNNSYSDFYVIRTDSELNYPPIKVNENSNNIPIHFVLYQNYPNPFNPSTKIKYDIPKEGMIKIKIYDLLAKEIYSLNEYRLPGTYEVLFDGSKYASGVYFYKIETDDFVNVKKMVLIK